MRLSPPDREGDAFSDGDRRFVERWEQAVLGAVLVLLLDRKLDGAGAHALRRRVEARNRLAVAVRLCGLEQLLARQDDAVVGRAQMLARAVLDRSHGLLQRRVLHRDALDARVVASRLLALAVD